MLPTQPMSPTPSADSLPIAGITPLTTLDFPGQLAAVVFLQGCPWRCGYCQNSSLLPRATPPDYQWQEIKRWLRQRLGLLDAVVFSGGEPTLHQGLADAVMQTREMGFRTGLHSAGIYPDRLRNLLPVLDWVGLDIKAPEEDYPAITGVEGSGHKAWQSAAYLADSNTAHEIRTTVHPDQLNETQLINMADRLVQLGIRHFVIQRATLARCMEPGLKTCSSARLSDQQLSTIGARFPCFSIRDTL